MLERIIFNILSFSLFIIIFFKIIKKNDTQAIDIKTLKMFTTTKCNLDCAYCLIEKNLENRDVDHHNLGLEDGINVLSSFSKLAMQQRTSKKTIMLYGGEQR